MKKKFLIIGCGSIGKRHIENLLSLGESDISVFDVNTSQSQKISKELSVTVESSLESAMAKKPYCVFITTPTAFHMEPALLAAKQGCHLFIEKPLSQNWDHVPELIDLVDKNKLITMIGCNLRFHPNLSNMKKEIESGRLGKLYSVGAEMGSYLPDWRPQIDYRTNYSAKRELGGGVILDCIHELDYLRWMGGEFADLVCMADKQSNLEISSEDLAVFILQFKSGCLGTLHLDYIQQSSSRTCKWVGEKGVMRWDLKEGKVHFYDNHTKKWKVVHQVAENFKLNDMYVNEMKYFLDCLDKNKQPMSNVKEAATVLQWTLKAHEKAGLTEYVS